MEEYKLVISIIAAIIALSSAFVSWYFAKRSAKRTDKALELQYLSKIYDWSKDVINTLSEACSLGIFDPERMPEGYFFMKRCEVYTKLSSLLDQGQLFFPNYDIPFGKEKPTAYQGIRREILDPIKDAVILVEKMNYLKKDNNESLSKELKNKKRDFVSEIQNVIGPREHELFFQELRGKHHLQNLNLEIVKE